MALSTKSKLVAITAHLELFADGDGDKLLHYVASAPYVRAVHKAGGIPVVLPIVDTDEIPLLFERFDALVITGGCDVDPTNYGAEPHPQLGAIDPARDTTDIAVAQAAVAHDFPTLAVCRGIQVLNVAMGGTLVQHVDDHSRLDAYNQHVHTVKIEPDSRLAGIVGATELGVNSLHHQVLDQLGPDVRATAVNPDGHVEGIEIVGAPHVLGVQWHPEMMRHLPEHLALFEQLLG